MARLFENGAMSAITNMPPVHRIDATMLTDNANHESSPNPSPRPPRLRGCTRWTSRSSAAGSAARWLPSFSAARVIALRSSIAMPSIRRLPGREIGGDQLDVLRRLGLLDSIAAASTPFNHIVNVHRGHVLSRTYSEHYGLLYQDLVRAVRAQIPSSGAVPGRSGRETSRRGLTSADHVGGNDVVDTRLVILASGMSVALAAKLGIARRVVFEKHRCPSPSRSRPDRTIASAFPALTYLRGAGPRLHRLSEHLSGGRDDAGQPVTFRDHRDPGCAISGAIRRRRFAPPCRASNHFWGTSASSTRSRIG